jgi:hypothetical protein
VVTKKVDQEITKTKQVNRPGLTVNTGKENLLIRKEYVMTELSKLYLMKKILMKVQTRILVMIKTAQVNIIHIMTMEVERSQLHTVEEIVKAM